ncbi:hypothetical protein LV89_03767 [Arcicella aurantiaca]|uniref:Uncharacterized protein n=1 Tax=Arcicella aurantiaca TaxID=591202 RepID=A0A316DPR4_9BACT|nr:hypothetical protein [Arcicella aurantiaca]PWK20227.1 hypothetical protein LV89_03767 [Arcicella aurantiaca]
MLAFYFVIVFSILIVVGLHISYYYSKEKAALTTPILFTLCSLGFIFLVKQNFELLNRFTLRQDCLFILKERVSEKRKGSRKIFLGYNGVLLKNNSNENGFLPTQTFYDFKDEKLSIDDSVKVWYLQENDKLILQTQKTKTNGFLIISIIEQIFMILLFNSLWYWVFKSKKS